MPEINQERVFGSDKIYDGEDEVCPKCGTPPPSGLKFGMKPCPDIRIVNGLPTGWCGLVHYVYVCVTCRTMIDFDEFLNRKKVFFMNEKKVLVRR